MVTTISSSFVGSSDNLLVRRLEAEVVCLTYRSCL
jgi:hypothetical protein